MFATHHTTPSPHDVSDGEHGLLARATAAAQRYRDLAPDVFDQRHDHWPLWTRRAVLARWIATALGVAIDNVLITGDPDRPGGVSGHSDLITVTDPDTGELWRFIPDMEGPGWLFLDECPECHAPAVPIARVVTLADLGNYLDPDHDDERLSGVPPDFDGDPAHHPHCPYAPARD